MAGALRLHHVGYVVADIEAAMPGFVRTLGAVWDGRIWEDPVQRVKVAFLITAPEDAQIELVTPAGAKSPVAGFLAERGGGLHHVCYEVEDLTAEIAAMRARGAILARPPSPPWLLEAVALPGCLPPKNCWLNCWSKPGKKTIC